MVLSSVIAVPLDGSTVTILSGEPLNASQVSIRNTGSVNLLLGSTVPQFPLLVGEFLGLDIAEDDIMLAAVQTTGSAGQITLLQAG